MAANAADIDIVDILLQSGKVDVNIKDKKGQTPLVAFILGYAGYGADASEHGELADVLLRLLSHLKIEPRAKDKMQRTPLFYAATEGLELFARILVEGGRGGAADKDKLGRTPLSQAAAKGHEEIVRRFLAAENFDEEDLRFAYEEAKKKGRMEEGTQADL
ncbi:NB-ARC domain-containing protein [Neofusicoccum parvum]|nr:NB-ARC domain-containing protein [Neofusicoccum parvum]